LSSFNAQESERSTAGEVSRSRVRLSQLRHSDVARIVAFVIAARVLLLAAGYLWLAATPGPTVEETSFTKQPVIREVEAFRTADVSWYLDIARHGYEERSFSDERRANWAFFPLYPVVWAAASTVVPFEMASGILLSTLFFILAMVLLYRLLAPDIGDRAALLTVVFVTVFPASYYALRPGPEALFLLLSVGAFLSARNRIWLAAGSLGALATLTRPQGALLIVPLAYMCYRQVRRTGRFDVSMLSLALIPAALIGFMVYLREVTGNAFAWLDIQRAWRTGLDWPFSDILSFVLHPRVTDWWGWNLTPVSVLATVGAVVLVVLAWRMPKVRPEYAIWASVNVVVLLSRDVTQAAPRFILPIFPLMLVVAVLLERRPAARVFFVYVCGVLQVMFFLAFLQGEYWALT
jgi:Gpi18-like mannosyltransferase